MPVDFTQIFILLGQLSSALLVLLAAARPVTAVLKVLSLMTPWSWDEVFLGHVDRIIGVVEKALRTVTGAK